MKASRTLLWLALAAASPAFAQQSIGKISDDVQTSAGQRYGSLATVSGDIHVVAGVQAGSVHTVSGDITVDPGAGVGEVASTSGEVKLGDKATARGVKTVSGNLQLGRGVQVDGDVTAVSGEIFADHGSRISGDVTAVSGAVGLVQTEVGGRINFVSANVTVGIGSHVKGGIRLGKPTYGKQAHPPRVVIGPDAVVDGPLEFELPVKLYVHSSAKVGPISGATPIAFSTPTPPKD